MRGQRRAVGKAQKIFCNAAYGSLSVFAKCYAVTSPASQ